MIKINSQKNGSAVDKINTLVVAVRKNGKNIESIGADKLVAEKINSCFEDGMTIKDFQRGTFLRGALDGTLRNILVIGLTDKYETHEDARKTGATIVTCLKANKVRHAGIVIDGFTKGFKNEFDAIQALVEGALLCDYSFDELKSKNPKTKDESPKEHKLEKLDLITSDKNDATALNNAIKTAETLIGCVNFSRRLGDMPGNLMTPEILADETKKAARGSKLKVTVWDKARIKKEKFGGLLGVSLGSAKDPRFIIMEYNGAAKNKKPVCFVGKGLTFDCGGISIKPSGGMEEMKYDMCGGANVIGTMLAISRLKLKINAIGLVPSTENMPGPLANKPGDVLVARNGKTVEVDNTDAEGRLILMDALSYASELKPCAIFDAATLTGACVVALGNSYTGSFTRDVKIRQNIDAASEVSGEAVWHMPINDDHVSDMKGTYADLNNISSTKGAGSSTAAAFLEQFVDKNIPWAHFDIAGTGWNVGNRLNYCSRKGASGVMIRTFVELAKIYGK